MTLLTLPAIRQKSNGARKVMQDAQAAMTNRPRGERIFLVTTRYERPHARHHSRAKFLGRRQVRAVADPQYLVDSWDAGISVGERRAPYQFAAATISSLSLRASIESAESA